MPDEVATVAPTNGDASNADTGEPNKTHKDNSDKTGAPHAQGCADEESLTIILQKRQDELLQIISKQSRRRWWRPKTWLDRNDPELLRVYGIIYDGLGEAQRLLAKSAPDSRGFHERILRRLCALFEKGRVHARTDDIHAAWEFAASIERVLLILGDDEYVIAQIESEHEMDQKKAQGSWSEYLAVETLEGLLKNYRSGGLRERAVECLSLVHGKRCAYMRTLRACNEMKAHYLNRLAFGLALLLFLLIETIYLAPSKSVGASLSQSLREHFLTLITFSFKLDFADDNVRSALLAAMTGAIGSTLSGFYKLRDATGGIASLRAFRSARRAQPFVGATVGVLMMLLIKSGVLTGVLLAGAADGKTEMDWLRLAVFCFFAGFSEPLFLGVVQRVAGAADGKAQVLAESSTAGLAVKGGDGKK